MADNENQQEKDKHVKISADRHRELKVLSAKTGREMREIMEEAFDQYLSKQKNDEV